MDSKWPVHLVLRARESRLRTPKAFGRVHRLVHEIAGKYGFKVYEFANAGNHLHLIVRVSDRQRWAGYIRELTGRIALAAKTRRHGRFWLHRPFTRIIRSWREAFRWACDYVELNRLEAEGFVKREQIGNLRRLRLLFSDA